MEDTLWGKHVKIMNGIDEGKEGTVVGKGGEEYFVYVQENREIVRVKELNIIENVG